MIKPTKLADNKIDTFKTEKPIPTANASMLGAIGREANPLGLIPKECKN